MRRIFWAALFGCLFSAAGCLEFTREDATALAHAGAQGAVAGGVEAFVKALDDALAKHDAANPQGPLNGTNGLLATLVAAKILEMVRNGRKNGNSNAPGAKPAPPPAST